MILCPISRPEAFSDPEPTHLSSGWDYIRKGCKRPWKMYVVIPQSFPQGTIAIHSVHDTLEKEDTQIF